MTYRITIGSPPQGAPFNVRDFLGANFVVNQGQGAVFCITICSGRHRAGAQPADSPPPPAWAPSSTASAGGTPTFELTAQVVTNPGGLRRVAGALERACLFERRSHAHCASGRDQRDLTTIAKTVQLINGVAPAGGQPRFAGLRRYFPDHPHQTAAGEPGPGPGARLPGRQLQSWTKGQGSDLCTSYRDPRGGAQSAVHRRLAGRGLPSTVLAGVRLVHAHGADHYQSDSGRRATRRERGLPIRRLTRCAALPPVPPDTITKTVQLINGVAPAAGNPVSPGAVVTFLITLTNPPPAKPGPGAGARLPGRELQHWPEPGLGPLYHHRDPAAVPNPPFTAAAQVGTPWTARCPGVRHRSR